MQLGARWRVGDPPHRSVPQPLHDMIAAQEAAHPGAVSWTLTWLEGRPRCALDDVALVTLDAAGCPKLVADADEHTYPSDENDDEDDWLR